MNIHGVLGLILFPVIAWLLANKRNTFPLKMVLVTICSQFVFGLLFLKVPPLRQVLVYLNEFVLAIEKASSHGAQFMFGYLAGGKTPFEMIDPGANFIIAFRILPIILVVSALSAALFHLGVLPWMIKMFSRLLQRTLKISGVEGFGVSASLFMGIVETPLLIKPLLKKMTLSSTFMILTACMSTVAGTVMVLYASVLGSAIEDSLGHILVASLMSAPASILFARLMYPKENDQVQDLEEIKIERNSDSVLEAMVNGTMEGVQLVLGVAAMIIVLFALVFLVDQMLALLPFDLSLKKIFSFAFFPFVWLMGIPLSELSVASELMATKTVFNEFVSYQALVGLEQGALSDRGQILMTYAMCGFANFGSLGLLIGSLATLVPERKKEFIVLAVRSMISGTLATMMTGTVVGMILLV